MASASLSAEMRNDRGKGVARKLRAAGRVPGVVYGHGREPQSLSLVARDLDKLLSQIAAGSTVIELTLGRATTKTLIREIQRHPFKKQILHIDFMELVAGEKVIVDIPLVFVGVPEGVRLCGALLEQIVHSIEVNVDPSSIPNHIDVDVTNLAMGHSL
ncbi:MAG TPA: 50S ribosomal protein L25, partial [Gemmatimonadaceae bacterium]|nr:50S ribosomal protein L25 [Gemmatimonadaceae bacterium]